MSKMKETINLHEQQSAENGTHTRFLSRRDKNKRSYYTFRDGTPSRAVYSSSKEDDFFRTRPTYGYTNSYDVKRATEADLDTWLKDNGFELNGWERDT